MAALWSGLLPVLKVVLLRVAGPGALFSPALALSFGLPFPSCSPGQGYRNGSCRSQVQALILRNLLHPQLASTALAVMGTGRQVTAVVSRLLTLSPPGAEDGVQQPWG